MSFTYDPDLDTNLDWVRFLVDDTVETDAELTDEEITAVLAEQIVSGAALKYFAAARCLEHLSVKWLSAGRGVREKQVSKLRLRWGFDEKVIDAISQRICDLRTTGARLATPSTRSKVFNAF